MAYCLKCVLWCWGIKLSNCARSHVRRLLTLPAGTNRVWEKGRWLAPPKLSPNRKLKQAGVGVSIHTKCFSVVYLQSRDNDGYRKEEESDHFGVKQILFEYSNLLACFFLGLTFAVCSPLAVHCFAITRGPSASGWAPSPEQQWPRTLGCAWGCTGEMEAGALLIRIAPAEADALLHPVSGLFGKGHQTARKWDFWKTYKVKAKLQCCCR